MLVGLPTGIDCGFPNPQPKGNPMKFINPTVTIQNMEGPDFAVTVVHSFSDIESISFTVRVPRSSQELGAVQKAALERATELLQTVSNKMR